MSTTIFYYATMSLSSIFQRIISYFSNVKEVK